jgi:hypothetical protein
MDYYISKSGHKYANDIDNYCNGKIIEVISKKSGLKYLLCTTNKIELMIENLKKDYKDYMCGVIEKYSEIYEIMKDVDVKIEIVELLPCSSKYEMEVGMTRILRDKRCEYININLYRRKKGEMCEDIISGVEDRYIERYKGVIRCEKFLKYIDEIKKIKESLCKKKY